MLKKIIVAWLFYSLTILAYETKAPLKTNATKNSQIISVSFYDNPKCQGKPTAKRQISLQKCFNWTRKTKNNLARENSANNFKCYQNTLCYTQYPLSKDCEVARKNLKKNKYFSTTCSLEGTGNSKTWAKITNGTKQCPIAPKNFRCPK